MGQIRTVSIPRLDYPLLAKAKPGEKWRLAVLVSPRHAKD